MSRYSDNNPRSRGTVVVAWDRADRGRPDRHGRMAGSIVDEMCAHHARTLDIDMQQEVKRDGKN